MKAWTTITFLIITVIPFIVFGFPQIIGASESYVVVSGSMKPSIPEGSVIFTENTPISQIEETDIITFQYGESLTTHRVIDKETVNNTIRLKTKGDANSEPDPGYVTDTEYEGRTMFSVPFVGYIFQGIRSSIGLFLLILLPATLIIYLELNKVFEEIEN